MVTKESAYINKTPELVAEVEALRVAKGLSKVGLARDAHVGHTTLEHLYNLDHQSRINRHSFARLASVLTDTVEGRRQLFTLAGIPTPSFEFGTSIGVRIEQSIDDLDLNSGFRTLLEDAVMAFIDTQGPIYRQMQSLQESLQAPKSKSVRRVS